MKKSVITLTVFLTGMLLTSCGGMAGQETPWMGIAPGSDLEAVTERTEYYDLTVESENLFGLGLWEKNPEEYYSDDIGRGILLYHMLGVQFAMGEPVQLWSEASSAGVNIYLYRTDGSREVLAEGLSDGDCSFVDGKFSGYVDQDKNCYFYCTDYPKVDGEHMYVGTVMKVLSSGEVQYRNTLEPGFRISDICQAEDGRLYLLLADATNHEETIVEFDRDTGQMVPEPRLERSVGLGWLGSLGAAGSFPARVDLYGIELLDTEKQSTSRLLYFDGTSYGLHGKLLLQDFRVLEDGTMEFLWTNKDGRDCFLEKLRMEKVEKTPVVVRGFFEQETWLSEKAALFNRKSNDYHVVMEICSADSDLEDFARLTSVQVGAGKGPDILCGDSLLGDYLSGMLEKGALEVLNPYMEASGIREEDYFPLVFSMWRKGEEICSVTPRMSVYYEEMDAEVLGSREVPDIEALADALLAQEGKAVYRKGLTSGGVLRTLLQGSESLWGMVDWGQRENDANKNQDSNGGKYAHGRCDFNTPLFAKLLEVAGRYGYNDRKAQEPEITDQILLPFFFDFNSPKEQEEKGKVSVGVLFDDGCHVVSDSWYTMAINANSANKEGAWEFIAFLLGEEVQYKEEVYLPPVQKEAFDKWLEWELWRLSEVRFENGKKLTPVYYGENISKEKREAYKKAIEDARPLPIRTAPILEIILEEAEDYFGGSKSAEEVSKVINNRVQLYLDEQR